MDVMEDLESVDHKIEKSYVDRKKTNVRKTKKHVALKMKKITNNRKEKNINRIHKTIGEDVC
jgi:hypothetical protein